jgi:hypothetical protein
MTSLDACAYLKTHYGLPGNWEPKN